MIAGFLLGIGLFHFLSDVYQIVCANAGLGKLSIVFTDWRTHSSYHIVHSFSN